MQSHKQALQLKLQERQADLKSKREQLTQAEQVQFLRAFWLQNESLEIKNRQDDGAVVTISETIGCAVHPPVELMENFALMGKKPQHAPKWEWIPDRVPK